MNKRLLLATTAVLSLATSAMAQNTPGTSTSPTTQRQPDATSGQTPSGSAQTTTAPSSSSQPSSGTSANQAQTSSPSGQTGNNPQSTQSQTGSSSSQPGANAPASSAQTGNQPQQGTGSTTTAQQPQQGTSTTNTAQQPQQGAGSTNTAQQPAAGQNSTASSSTNVNVNINDQQRTRISASISRLNVQPVTNVNFSLSVGTVVPADVRLQPLPAEVVEVVPQYRGYDFVLVRDEIVIVEPSTKKIVTVLPYSGRSTAAAPARVEQKTTFTDRDREVIRKHVKAHPVEKRTSGSTVRTEIRRGERVPEGVEVEAFPEEVYRDAPTLREYRYIHRDSRTYVVEPRERRIIEEID